MISRLQAVHVAQLVGGEPPEVQQLRRVVHVGSGARRHDLLPVAVPLAPERGAPRPVEGVEVAVPVLPARCGTGPRTGRRSTPARTRCRRATSRPRGAPAYRSTSARTNSATRSRYTADPGQNWLREPTLIRTPDASTAQRRRVQPRQPRRRRRGRRRQVDRDPARVQQVEHLVEPVPAQLVRARLEHRPREHPDGHQVDARLAHERHVLAPHLAAATAPGCSRPRTGSRAPGSAPRTMLNVIP